MRALFCAVIAISACLTPTSLQCQSQTALRAGVGVVVRITPVKGKRLIGAVSETSSDSLAIVQKMRSGTSELRIARDDIQRIQMRTGKSRTAGALVKGAIGLVGGAIIGGLVGYVTYKDPPPPKNIGEALFQCMIGCSAAEDAVFSAIALGGVGFIAGSVYGAATGIDRWVEVPRR